MEHLTYYRIDRDAHADAPSSLSGRPAKETFAQDPKAT
jgi:hypothetical protein